MGSILPAQGQVDPDDLDYALAFVGRSNGPALLWDLYSADLLNRRLLAPNIGGVWSAAEIPEYNLEPPMWRQLFVRAGYTENGKPAHRPHQPLILYRGATPDRRAGWSWTNDVNVAAAYAFEGVRGRKRGRVWVAEVEPARLLAFHDGREEGEYVVDTEGMEIGVAADVVEPPGKHPGISTIRRP
jgi:hypothetical protein